MMCFVHEDYDWIAMVNEHSDGVASVATKCDECDSSIAPSAFVHRVHQQEHEECHACDDGFCDCPRDDFDEPVCILKGCQCENPDFGETFDYVRCEGCDKFLRAVKALEIEEGCSEHEAMPGMPFFEDFQDIGREESKKYWQKALAMFPEIKAHLGLLWRRMF